ncbi:methyltransferase domain-containing protein [Halomicroarcula sp. S1AR25-4]|uniref:class I SAM-dependent methyltransferase n=1 Tax=Haloarcula sp. S1AR25-4 TaxID=2950538 RepID=UPI002875FD17|nr:methyltransferase domain-containing protein [Halomicroarcula sp. S1AR25-4]MDS0278644.1 methyltransferase domain-containing protein [Halomicroarcula sp. S1AR25-4]
MTDGNDWNPDDYDDGHGFVYEYGSDMLDLLDPKPGDRILDLGCGTGHLTADIADTGAETLGIDASAEMVRQAHEAYPSLDFEQADARAYAPAGSFDAVFSNAALHWIPGTDHDAVLSTVADALTADGRFVAEFGGRGNVRHITDALEAELAERGYEVDHPWYFPSIGEYASRLESAGFEVRFARLFDRPTELDGGEDGLREWVGMFGDEFFENVTAEERERVLDAVEDRLRGELFDADSETWTADYRRLRFVATK